MCKGLIGKKLGMTGIFSHNGEYVSVTVIKVGPCVVTQIKRRDIDGYEALQLAFDEKKPEKTIKPLSGHFKKSSSKCFYVVKEFAVNAIEEYEIGQVLDLNIFKIGEKVDISGKTKGRGFSGVMKRHGFSGGRKTHGCKSHRVPGSIGCSAWPGRVIKGKKMPGRYGGETKTVNNLEIIDIRLNEGVILVKGSIPGAKSSNVMIKKVGFDKESN